MAKRQCCKRCGGSGIEPDPIAIGAKMRAFRLAAGLSLRDVAGKMGFSPPYVSDLELGRRPWGPKATVKYREALR